VDIDAAPSDVFRFVATDHFRNHPRWDPSVVEISQTEPGALHPGTTARVVRSNGGRRVEGSLTVTEYAPDRDFAAVTRFGPFQLVQQARFTPAPNGGTHLTLVIDTHARGPLRPLLPILRPRFARTMRASLRSIKGHVESQR
jgi:hypothetical protein